MEEGSPVLRWSRATIALGRGIGSPTGPEAGQGASPCHRGDEGRSPGLDRVSSPPATPGPTGPSVVSGRGSSASLPDGLDPLVGRGGAGSRRLPSRIISGWTPTGLATTGRPAAWYWRTLRPHLPRLQRSSGIQLIPTSAEATSAASVASDQGTSTTGRESNRRKRSQTIRSRTPGDLAADPLPERPLAVEPGQGAAPSRSRPGRAPSARRGPGSAGGVRSSMQVGITRTRSGWAPGRRGRSRPGRRCPRSRRRPPGPSA